VSAAGVSRAKGRAHSLGSRRVSAHTHTHTPSPPRSKCSPLPPSAPRAARRWCDWRVQRGAHLLGAQALLRSLLGAVSRPMLYPLSKFVLVFVPETCPNLLPPTQGWPCVAGQAHPTHQAPPPLVGSAHRPSTLLTRRSSVPSWASCRTRPTTRAPPSTATARWALRCSCTTCRTRTRNRPQMCCCRPWRCARTCMCVCVHLFVCMCARVVCARGCAYIASHHVLA